MKKKHKQTRLKGLGGPCPLCGRLIAYRFPVHVCTPPKGTRTLKKYDVTLLVITRSVKMGAIYASDRGTALEQAEAQYNRPFTRTPGSKRELQVGTGVTVHRVEEARDGKT